jgi:hypothetical protein
VTELLTIVPTKNGVFRIAYDGTILGDDRAFQTKELAEQEIRKRLAKDARDAVTYNRPLLYAYTPD